MYTAVPGITPTAVSESSIAASSDPGSRADLANPKSRIFV